MGVCVQKGQFEYRGYHVEIHEQFPSRRLFWTVGDSPDRFYGPCDYFTTVQDAQVDAEREIDLLLKNFNDGFGKGMPRC